MKSPLLPFAVVLLERRGRDRRRHGSVSGARDVLLVFEGGTGDKGDPGQPSSQSLMGFVLLRHAPTGDHYDVHVTFRGNRSGSAGRARSVEASPIACEPPFRR